MIYIRILLEKLSLIAIFKLFIISCMEINIISTFECFTYMASTCRNNVVTKWNNQNIGRNLKEWIKSVSVEKIDEHSALLWKDQEHHSRGNHCKTITIKKNDFFSSMAPEIYSSNVTILGKIHHSDKGNDWEPKERQFVGPVWATINDQAEWYIDEMEGVVSALSQEAKLHNGFYYGILDNEYMKIRK